MPKSPRQQRRIPWQQRWQRWRRCCRSHLRCRRFPNPSASFASFGAASSAGRAATIASFLTDLFAAHFFLKLNLQCHSNESNQIKQMDTRQLYLRVAAQVQFAPNIPGKNLPKISAASASYPALDIGQPGFSRLVLPLPTHT
jgi:hypothetical protein